MQDTTHQSYARHCSFIWEKCFCHMWATTCLVWHTQVVERDMCETVSHTWAVCEPYVRQNLLSVIYVRHWDMCEPYVWHKLLSVIYARQWDRYEPYVSHMWDTSCSVWPKLLSVIYVSRMCDTSCSAICVTLLVQWDATCWVWHCMTQSHARHYSFIYDAGWLRLAGCLKL